MSTEIRLDHHVAVDKLLGTLRGKAEGNALNAQDVSTKATGTVDNLATLLNNIKAGLSDVQTTVDTFDSRGYRRFLSDGNLSTDPVKGFGPTWQNIQALFQKYVSDSKVAADTAAKHAEEFRTVMLPYVNDSSIDVKNKQQRLESYVRSLEDTQHKARSLSDSFAAVKFEMESFSTSFKQALDDTGLSWSSSALSQDYTATSQKISELKQQLESYQDMSATHLHGIASHSERGPNGKRIGSAGSPGTKQNGGSQFIKLIENTEHDRFQRQLRLDQITKLQGESVSFHDKTNGTVKEVISVSLKVHDIVTVWSSLRTEAQLIREKLDKAAHAPTAGGFKHGLTKRCIDDYEALEMELKGYASSV